MCSEVPLSETFGIEFEHLHFTLIARNHLRQNLRQSRVIPAWSLEVAVKSMINRVIKKGDLKERRDLEDCHTIWCGFKPRQHEVVFGVILVPQNNTIMCKHSII